MLIFSRLNKFLHLWLMLFLGTLVHAATLPLQTPGLHPQFGGVGGMAAAKILQKFNLPASPNDLFAFIIQYALTQRVGNTLPLNLNADAAYPIVENSQLPGGAFQGKPLHTTAGSMRSPLPVGDYVVPVMAYCTQYSVHRAGQGTAYKLAPVQGTQAEAISTLLWRGTLAGKSPQDLQATNWAIQSGVIYGSMPKPYQALIDQLIPDYRDKLKGNMLDVIQTTYKDVTTDPRKFLQVYIKEKYNTTIPLMLLPKITVPAPPLNTVLAKMGTSGHMVLDAQRQSDIFLTAYTTKELGEQKLFEGQGEQLPPEPASEGPWTVRIPGQVYMRFIIKSGNMHGDNLMQIRILPNTTTAFVESQPHLVLASYPAVPQTPSIPAATSVYGLLGVKTVGDSNSISRVQAVTSAGIIGYSVGGEGTQALVAVANAPAPSSPASCLKKLLYQPYYYKGLVGLCIYVGANSSACSASATDFNWAQAYQTNLDTKKMSCKINTPHPDACPYEGPQSPPSELYRPYSQIDEFRSPNIGAWVNFDVDYIFRDLPARNLETMTERAASIKKHHGTSDPSFHWHTAFYNPSADSEALPGAQELDNAAFVSLPAAGVQRPFTPLAKFSYGFSVSSDQQTLSVDALTIADALVQGPMSYSIEDLKKESVPPACIPEHAEVLAPPPPSVQP